MITPGVIITAMICITVVLVCWIARKDEKKNDKNANK